jgi:predicted ArsR family transcriptional regulator
MTRLNAIADPIRLSVVRRLAEGGDASLRELADAAGVHPNTVRPHVAALERAGAVLRASVPAEGRGRPPLAYRLAEGWAPPTTDYRGLAELLAATVLRGGRGPEEVREVGRSWGRHLHGRPGGHEVERDLPLALERLGFHARVEDDVLRLSQCPCSVVLPDRPELICELAIAVADGVLAGSGSALRVGRREHDTEGRACAAKLAPA